MQILTEKTVREIALERPSSIRVFETLGIDYCCGGKRPLTEACSKANLDFARVLELLANAETDSQAPDADDWREKPLADLVFHIVHKHHSYVRQETPRIDGLLAKVVAKHGPNHPEVCEIQALFTAVGQELSTHMLKEEQILFPYLVQAGPSSPAACFGSVKSPIAKMMAEHDDAGALLARIRLLSNGYTAPAGACPTYMGLYRALDEFERDLHQHVHLENNILFPRAVAMEQAS